MSCITAVSYYRASDAVDACVFLSHWNSFLFFDCRYFYRLRIVVVVVREKKKEHILSGDVSLS
jgi:hypothetical protein